MSLTKSSPSYVKGSISRVNKRFSSAILYQGESIVSNGANNTDRLISNNGLYMFVMQGDGNLVQYGFDTHPGGNIISVAWAFQTVGNYNFQNGPVTLDSNGNLIHYNNSGQNIWQVGANGAGVAPYRLVLRDDGKVVLYDSNNTIWWQTNNSSGGAIGDISIVNSPTLSFPGTSGNYIDLGSNHPAHVNTTTDNMFFEAWIYATSFPGNDGFVFYIGGDNTGSEDVGLFVSGQYGLNWRLWNPSASFSAPTGVGLVTYFWYHVAGSWNASTKTLYSFIDGTLLGSTILTGTPRYNSSSRVQIGAANQNGYNGDYYPFAGYIKDVRVIKGGTVPTSSFTPERSNWALNALPSYASTGTNVLSLYAQFFQATIFTRSNGYITNCQLSITSYNLTNFYSSLSSSAQNSIVSIYSLRALNSASLIPVVQIRRSSDSVLQDFYGDCVGRLFTSPSLYGTTLISWLNGATAYVQKWYDQSTNGYNLAQLDTTKQPVINTSTTPYSVIFDGASTWLYNASFNFNFGAGSFTLRYVVSNNVGGCVLFKAIGTNFTWYTPHEKKFWLGNGGYDENGIGNYPCQVGNSENYVISSTSINAGSKNSIVHKANAVYDVPIYINGSSASISSGIYMNNDAGNYLIIGHGGNASHYNGNIFELQLFSTPLSDSDRNKLENFVPTRLLGTLTGILSTLSGTAWSSAQGIYGVKSLYLSSTKILTIRRSYDNAIVDVIADNSGNYTVSTGGSYMNWIGTGDGYITQWWDQSGKANHGTQTNTSIQPLFDYANKQVDFKPDRYFNLPNGTVPYGNANYTMVVRHNTINNTQAEIIGSGTYNQNLSWCCALEKIYGVYADYWWGNDLDFGSFSTGNIITTKYDNTIGRTGYINGSISGTNTNTNRNSANIQNSIGTAFRGGNGLSYVPEAYLNGELYYVQIYSTPLSDADRIIAESITIT